MLNLIILSLIKNIMRFVPAKEKSISDISKEDVRVRIIGTIVDIDENKIIIDDGKETCEIIIGEYSHIKEKLASLRIGTLVKVIARVYPSESNFKLFGEVVQNVDNLDVNLYKEAKKIIEELEVV